MRFCHALHIYECQDVRAISALTDLNRSYLSTEGEKLWKPISAKTRYILQWMKCVSREKICIFQAKRCIFQLERCNIPIWRPPDISGGRRLENEMYISSTKMYISTGEMYYSYRYFYLAAAR